MKTLFRILGTAAAVVVTGAAIVVLDKILNQKDPLHVEEVEFPEEAEKDAEEAEKTAEAYEEAEAKEEAKAADAAAEAAEEAAPEAPAPAENAPQTQPETAKERPVYDPEAPNANPVEAGPAVAPQGRERQDRRHQDRRCQRFWRLGRAGLQGLRKQHDPRIDAESAPPKGGAFLCLQNAAQFTILEEKHRWRAAPWHTPMIGKA